MAIKRARKGIGRIGSIVLILWGITYLLGLPIPQRVLMQGATAAPSATPVTRPPIAYGQTVQGKLEAPDGDAYYQFTGQQGDSIALTVEFSTDGLMPILLLLNPPETRVIRIEKAADSSIRKLRLRIVLLETSIFVVRLLTPSGGASAGTSFSLSLTLQNPTPTPSPLADLPRIAPLPVGNLRADLSDLVRFRLYAFFAGKGDPIRVGLETEGALQAGLYLFDAEFKQQIASAVLGQRLELSAPDDGLYWLVAARSAESGGFTLRVEQPDKPYAGKRLSFEPPRIVPGIAEAVEIGPRFAAPYRFEAVAGMQGSLNLALTSGDPQFPLLLMADSTFKQVGLGEGYLTGPIFSRYETAYVLIARRGGPIDTSSGRYILNFGPALPAVTVPPPPTRTATPVNTGTRPINVGDTVSGTISDQQYIYYYTFQGTANDTLVIRMRAGAGSFLDPAVYLYIYVEGRPVLVDSAAGVGEATLRRTLDRSAQYLIIATRRDAAQGRTQGAFFLTLTKER